MIHAPLSCPMCHDPDHWKKLDVPVYGEGIAPEPPKDMTGQNYAAYRCEKCGYIRVYSDKGGKNK